MLIDAEERNWELFCFLTWTSSLHALGGLGARFSIKSQRGQNEDHINKQQHIFQTELWKFIQQRIVFMALKLSLTNLYTPMNEVAASGQEGEVPPGPGGPGWAYIEAPVFTLHGECACVRGCRCRWAHVYLSLFRNHGNRAGKWTSLISNIIL